MNKTVVQIQAEENSKNGMSFPALTTLELQAAVKKMKRSISWLLGGIKSKILLKSPQKQVLLTILHRNTEIVSHQESDSITFQVIEGRLKLEHMNSSLFIKKGSVLTLTEKGEYKLSNNEETAYLITMDSKNTMPEP